MFLSSLFRRLLFRRKPKVLDDDDISRILKEVSHSQSDSKWLCPVCNHRLDVVFISRNKQMEEDRKANALSVYCDKCNSVWGELTGDLIIPEWWMNSDHKKAADEFSEAFQKSGELEKWKKKLEKAIR